MTDLDTYLPDIVAGDPDAFARWVAGAEPRVRASVSSFAHQVDVEVVVQETLLRAWQVAPRVEVDARGNSLLRLSVRMARNLAIDHVRRARLVLADAPALERVIADACGHAAPSEPDPGLRAAIEDCRARLPPKPRRAFDLRVGANGGRSDAELAGELSMKLNTFLQNFGRARRLLADCLRGKGIDIREELR